MTTSDCRQLDGNRGYFQRTWIWCPLLRVKSLSVTQEAFPERQFSGAPSAGMEGPSGQRARLMLKGFKLITESKAVPDVFPQAQTLLTTLHWFCKPLSFPSQNIKELRTSKKANLYWKSDYKLLITLRHTNRLKFRQQRTYDLYVLLVFKVYDFYNTLKNVNYLIKRWFLKRKASC